MPGIDLSHLDRSISPCEDFVRYTSGMWLERTEIPPEEAVWGAFHEVRDRNFALLRALAEEAARASAPRGSVRQKVGDHWATGMDEAAIEAAGIAAIAPELSLVDGLTDRAKLPEVLARLHRVRLFGGFVVVVHQDPGDASRNQLWLQQGGLGMPDRDHYLKEDERSREIRQQYVAHVTRMLELAGDDRERAAYGAAAIFALETRLAHASMTRVDQRDPYKVYNKRTPAQLTEAAPWGWGAYFEALGARPLEDLNLRQPAFFAELARSFADVPLDQLRTYLRWHVLRSTASSLPAAFVAESFAFNSGVLQGVKEQKPRWKRVLESMDEHIGEELGQLYVERAFPPEAKRRVLELVEDLRAALRDRIRGLEWMGEATREQALRKLDAFAVKMGYPDRWRDHSTLEADRRSRFVRNVLRAREFHTRRDLAKLGRPVDRTEWRMSPQAVNAYYSPLMNEIVFPAGILQPPFFSPDADDAVNYGAIGMVIGHEMSHGFDDSGSRYDWKGDLREWWTPEDRAAYEARTDLIVRQFEEYEPLPGLRINGRLTLGENIGDLGGLKIAWAAFRRALERNGRTAPIDGFTPEQRFFLGFAQAWRSRIRDEALRLRLTIDPHSPSLYRVLGPLSNLPEFHEAFGCADGSAMRRPEAVRPSIW